jgi:hypothetical protein
MACPLYRLIISSWSVIKHGCHRQFLFLIGWFLKNRLLWNPFVQVVSEKIFFNRPIRNMFFNSSEQIVNKWAIVIEDLPRILPTKFRFIWQSGFRGEDFLEINQSETRIVCEHGRHRQFLFPIGWFLKNPLLWSRFAKWTETW